jgi:hypothetical protein
VFLIKALFLSFYQKCILLIFSLFVFDIQKRFEFFLLDKKKKKKKRKRKERAFRMLKALLRPTNAIPNTSLYIDGFSMIT